MFWLFLSTAWAESQQNFVYKVLQNGVEVGRRSVVITYIPSSKLMPEGAQKVEISSDISFDLAGKSIRYKQKGVGQFSKRRSHFVVSNQVDDLLTEFQGKQDSKGVWKVFTIQNGSFEEQQFSPLQAQNTSFDFFLPREHIDKEPLDCIVIDGKDLMLQNTVWKKEDKYNFPEISTDKIENASSIKTKNIDINSVWDKDGNLLGAKIIVMGTEFSILLEQPPQERYFGDIREENDFSGIQEQEL